MARDVLIKAGVDVPNPTFDPDVPYSEEFLIVAAKRICSYDETRVEMDCTDPSKGASGRIVRASSKDNGISIVAKSSKSASGVRGGLGDGRPLLVYIVLNSGDSFEQEWATHVMSDTMFDKDGKRLPWRFSSNGKGSLNEVLCSLYIEEILCPILGYPKSRDSHLGEQGVIIICDSDGTHLAYSVV